MILQKTYWTYNKLDNGKVKHLSEDLHITRPVARVLLNRGIESQDEARKFLNPDIEKLYDPLLLKNMDRVVNRIIKAMENKERICIYGDYDVDGIASISILLKYFSSINYPVDFYIPDRLEEGYGLNKEAIKEIVHNGTQLIITVDCGISSVDEVDYASSLGIDVIITDHHECQEDLPNAYAIINPLQEDCSYPFNMLCGCGLALKLIQALTPEEIFRKTIYEYLDIAAIATVADVVPLIDENRIIVKKGLDCITTSKNLGIQALLKVSGLTNRKLNTGHIAFGLAPRINAVGRISLAKTGVELLTTTDASRAAELAQLLDGENKHRQQIEETILNEAVGIIEENPNYKDDKVLVIYNENWHTGVIGIVASRIVERYYKPTIILNIEEGIAKGSARSIPEFNIFESMNQCRDLFIKFGGHHQAAGLSIDTDRLEKFQEQINMIAEEILTEDDLVPKITYDDMLQIEDINDQLIDELAQLEPFGIANPSPKFAMKSLVPLNARGVGSDGRHLKFGLQSNSSYIDCIAFNFGQFEPLLDNRNEIDIIFTPEYNLYNGIQRIQLNIKDIKISKSLAYRAHPVLRDYYRNLSIDHNEGDSLTIDSPLNINTGCKDGLVKDKIEKACKLNPLLILVNTLEQGYKLLSSLEYRERSQKTKIRVSYKVPGADSKAWAVDVVINPIVDKIDYKRYNNIILYDMFYFVQQVTDFLHKNNAEKTIFLYNSGDEESNTFVLESIIPTRDELVDIYKYLINNRSSKIVGTFNEFFNGIKEKYDLEINQELFNNALIIFSQGKLLTYELKNHIYNICIIEPTCKIDLKELEFTQYLQRKKDQYNSFKNTWLNIVTGSEN